MSKKSNGSSGSYDTQNIQFSRVVMGVLDHCVGYRTVLISKDSNQGLVSLLPYQKIWSKLICEFPF